ncbi:MAG TPA: TetR/AcrR family transcriptional regulator [Novosphingobium sp.]|nr:TetR/AcrR family transcriptional regulator [Novosphingobium sp.]
MLRAISPGHDAAPPARWQQRKSAATRQRLIDAGVIRLVEAGYGGLTTAAVAERCKVSRGAMHHHFPTRMALVEAVVEHVFYQRMRGFLEAYFAAIGERGEDTLVEIACDLHWQSVQSSEYAAYLELAVAARTDAELERCFTPAACRYDAVWTAEMIEAFPQWRRHWEAMKLANDLVLTAHMGMLLHKPVFGEGERMERLRRYISHVLRALYEEA